MVEVTEAELYQIIGELFVARGKTDQLLQIERQRREALEAELNHVRELVKPSSDDAV